MRFGIRAYLLILVTGVALVAGPELLLVRPYRGFERADVSRIGAAVEVRLAPSGTAARAEDPASDTDRLVAGLRRERAIRNAQTAVVLLLFAASVLFLAANIRGALRLRRDRAG